MVFMAPRKVDPSRLTLASSGKIFYITAMGSSSPPAHSLAVASGKGGVGKTTTSVNLALHYSRRGMKTLLIDADPLSDIATLLDITSPEESLGMGRESEAHEVFKLLDLLSLGRRRNPRQAGALLSQLMGPRGEHLRRRYRIIVVDLPAGLLEEEGWGFIDQIDRLVVVTNDEPTSHVAAGAFIRRAQQESSTISFRIWHNKYGGIDYRGFDPKDLPGNYNRNVAEEEKLDFSILDLKDMAYIPKDPTLDILQASPDLNLNIKRQMLERVELLYRDRIAQILGITPLPPRLLPLLETTLFSLARLDSLNGALKAIGKSIMVMMGGDFFHRPPGEITPNIKLFTPREEAELSQVLRLLKEDNLSHALRKLRSLLEGILESEENSQRLFSQGTGKVELKSLDRESSQLLVVLNEKAFRGGVTMKNLGGLLLFDFALFKLFGSPTVRKLIGNFIPWAKDSRGGWRRDKHSQIRWLVEADKSYHHRYLNLLKTLRPAVVSQVLGISQALGLQNLLFQKGRGPNQEVYLRLLTSFLHDVVNSGLGVIIGFRYRPASRAFQNGAERLWRELERGNSQKNEVINEI